MREKRHKVLQRRKARMYFMNKDYMMYVFAMNTEKKFLGNFEILRVGDYYWGKKHFFFSTLIPFFFLFTEKTVFSLTKLL